MFCRRSPTLSICISVFTVSPSHFPRDAVKFNYLSSFELLSEIKRIFILLKGICQIIILLLKIIFRINKNSNFCQIQTNVFKWNNIMSLHFMMIDGIIRWQNGGGETVGRLYHFNIRLPVIAMFLLMEAISDDFHWLNFSGNLLATRDFVMRRI